MELMEEMKNYYDVNEGMSKYFEKMKNAQTIATAVDRDVINDATLLQIGLDAMYECGLFEKALDEWEELDKTEQTWEKLQTHFIAAKEKFNLKKGFMTKKVTLDKPMPQRMNTHKNQQTKQLPMKLLTFHKWICICITWQPLPLQKKMYSTS